MSQKRFEEFFQGKARTFLERAVQLALEEDGEDLTSNAVFPGDVLMHARIVAKQDGVVAGLPLIRMILAETSAEAAWAVQFLAEDGDSVTPGKDVALICGPAAALLKAERVILNFLCHLSGIATETRRYADAMGLTSTRLLDTRKTMPCQRHLEKYAVTVGGGMNHRLDLEEMLMLKDTHIDQAGSITSAVDALRLSYSPCPPIEVECRDLDEVREAVECRVDRIMLDNMSPDMMRQALKLVSGTTETEASGNVSLENIREIAQLGVDYVSVGRITHSAPVLDFSMRTAPHGANGL